MDRKRNRSREGNLPPSTEESTKSSSHQHQHSVSTHHRSGGTSSSTSKSHHSGGNVYSSLPVSQLSNSATRITNPPSYQPRSYQSNGLPPPPSHRSSYHDQQPKSSTSSYYDNNNSQRKRRRDPHNNHIFGRPHGSSVSTSESSSRYNDEVGHIHLRGDELIGDNCKYSLLFCTKKKFEKNEVIILYFL